MSMNSSSRGKSKSDKSLCEKSMRVVTNIVRLSSFSIARKTLGATGKAAKDLSVPGSDYGDKVPEKEPMVPHHFSANKRSREPESRANPTYVMIKPVLSNGSTTHVIHEESVHAKQKKEEGVDGLASDYIRKMRKQFGCGL